MKKQLLMGVAAFCAMGLSAGVWAAEAATAELFADSLRGVRIEIENGDLCALCGKMFCRCLAKARRAAGDNN